MHSVGCERILACALLLAAAVVATGLARPAVADVDARMRSLFNAVGGYGTVDGPKMLNAQNQHVFSGGGINFRAPRRNYSLLATRGPSLSAGCGGIDFYAGSFSFINKDEFVALLRNIAANSVGLAFKTALCATSANLCQAIEDLQKTLESMNRFNIDSCEAAKSLVGGAIGSAERSSTTACLAAGRTAGLFADDSEGRSQCASDSGFARAQAAARNSADAEASPLEFVGGNLTWQVLGKLGAGLDVAEREFLMSMIGTQVVATASLAIRSFPPTITELSDLHEREIVLLRCDEPVACASPTATPATVSKTFVELAADRMERISTRLLAGLALTPRQLKFIAGAPVPVLAIARADAAGAAGLIDVGSQAVAYSIAHRFLTDSLRQATVAAAAWRSRSASEAQLVDALLSGSRSLRLALADQLHASLARMVELLELDQRLGETHQGLVRSRLSQATAR
ncbi:MAG: conjugal transfer protein TraH [Betaproteobacteria bacterium]|nr:conjugal transfer protein TraH [Betaproteobacteria bacterium]